MADTINYIGIDAAKEIYKRNKRRIDKLVQDQTEYESRLEAVEREATNVKRITENEVHTITGNIEVTSINYIR